MKNLPLSGILSPGQEKEAAKGFTLVELIVVITILAILGTIAFISLQGYSANSRDSVRTSDVNIMKMSLELFHLDAGKYPLPDKFEIVDYDGDILWYQGTFGETVVSQLSRNLNKIPTDSLSDKEYIYSVANNKNEYEILNLLEGDVAYNTTKPLSGILSPSQEKEATFLMTQTNAAGNSVRIPKITGQYNGVIIKTPRYIVPTPSIITAEEITVGDGLTLNAQNIKSQITDGGKNIPDIGNINFKTGALTGLKLSVYTGSVLKTDTNTKKEEVMQIIQAAYTGSELANEDLYKNILNKTTTDDLVALVNDIVLDIKDYSISSSSSGGGEEQWSEPELLSGPFTNIDGSTTPYLPDSASGADRFEFTSGKNVGGESIILDNLTGLYWQSEGVIQGTKEWIVAKSYCVGLELGGYTDWRLPDYTELNSIVDLSKYDPSIDITYFTAINNYYWSSTTFANGSSNAWGLHLSNGAIGFINKTDTYYVRCIR